MGTNRENFMKLVSNEKTDTLKRNKRRIKYRWFYRIRNKILLKWLLFKDKF